MLRFLGIEHAQTLDIVCRPDVLNSMAKLLLGTCVGKWIELSFIVQQIDGSKLASSFGLNDYVLPTHWLPDDKT